MKEEGLTIITVEILKLFKKVSHKFGTGQTSSFIFCLFTCKHARLTFLGHECFPVGVLKAGWLGTYQIGVRGGRVVGQLPNRGPGGGVQLELNILPGFFGDGV